MEIYLTKQNVMKIICGRFQIEFVEKPTGEIVPLEDEICWEGNPKTVDEKEKQD